MFAKFKSGNQPPQNPIEANPITQYFEIGKVVACAGPELVWKIHDAYRKSDGKVSHTMQWKLSWKSDFMDQKIENVNGIMKWLWEDTETVGDLMEGSKSFENQPALKRF